MIHHIQSARGPLREAGSSLQTHTQSIGTEAMADFREALKQSETNARPTQTDTTATTVSQGISTGVFTGLQMYPPGAGTANVPASSTMAAPVVTPAPPQALGSGSAVNSNGGVSYTAATISSYNPDRPVSTH